MKRRFRCSALLALVCTCAPVVAAQPDAGKAAGDRCEEAVAETVRRMRGRDAQDVEFTAPRRALAPAPEADEIRVKGEGHYRGKGSGPMSFTYSCAYDTKTGATSGVVFRDNDGASRADREPDLSNVSPEACETAAASLLKEKYPRIGRIAFGSDTRQLRPAPNAHTSLEGQGAMQRAPGMNSVPFRYRCEFEERSGRMISVQTSE